MTECYLQVVYYFINFQLADTQFPSFVRLEMDQNRKQIGRDRPSPLAAIFLLVCYADVGENKKLPQISQFQKLKKRYGTRLTQGYNWHGGSG